MGKNGGMMPGGRSRFLGGLVAIAALWGGSAVALEPTEQEILEVHNRYRTAAGAAPLVWSGELAADARTWAAELVRTARFEHATDTRGAGENLAIATAGAYGPGELVDLWGAERQYFRPGRFPNVSTTGNWRDVGHYTQMIWRGTTHLGCAIATGNGVSVLVCRYAPAGNLRGEPIR